MPLLSVTLCCPCYAKMARCCDSFCTQSGNGDNARPGRRLRAATAASSIAQYALYVCADRSETKYTKDGPGTKGGVSWTPEWLKFDNSYFVEVKAKRDDELLVLETDDVLFNVRLFSASF